MELRIPRRARGLVLDHDARSYDDIAAAFAGQPVGNLTRDEVLDNHHGHLGDEHRGLVGSPLLGKQARLLRRQGAAVPGAVSVLPRELYQAPRSWAEQA
jgi:hypothetical protein